MRIKLEILKHLHALKSTCDMKNNFNVVICETHNSLRMCHMNSQAVTIYQDHIFHTIIYSLTLTPK